MAISPKDRRDRADVTTRTARAETESGLQAARKKTARLKAERLARDEEAKAAAAETPPPPAKKTRSSSKGTAKQA